MKNSLQKLYDVITKYSNLLFLLITAAIFLTLASINEGEEKLPESKNGILDISNWNFDKKPTYTINGEIDFYWQQFPFDKSGKFNTNLLNDSSRVAVKTRKTWSSAGIPKKGYGTFVLQIKMPKSDMVMGIKTFRVKSACEVWVNGIKTGGIGSINKNEHEAIPSGLPLLIKLPSNSNIELVIPVSNYDHSLGGGITSQIKISPYNQLENTKTLNLIETSVAMTIAILMGFLLLVLFLDRKKKALLYLGLFSFSILLRIISIDEVIIYNLWADIPFTILQKGRYVGYHASVIFITLYFRQLLPEYIKKWFVYSTLCIYLISIAYVLVTSTYWSTKSAFSLNIVAVLYGLYMLYVAIRLLFSQNVLHKWIFVIIMFIAILIINDTLHLKGIIDTMFIGKYSVLLFFFVVLQTIIYFKFQKEIEAENELMGLMVNQKEMMIKEIHHRVKNNFQIVSSLLELQSKDIKDIKALQLANDGQNRLKSMAFIHQKLYQNTTGLIDFNEYLKKLVQEISVMYKSETDVEIAINAENIELDVDTAIPLGLMVNEIITNAYKYAFTGIKSPSLSVSMKKTESNTYTLEIIDNGIGINKKIDVLKAKSIGLRLIRSLVKQLNGSLEVRNDNGTTFKIKIKDTEERKLVD
ncbi:histidine kinase dimerization/phosphoacceptor domain -containing protein [uncultured Maribacter sp.]|uniref:sensor histidine kinase n=1 Tax=uncultured Maribacter sp. TaxID=431308 RepID=UPI00261F670B|nr:histidine kinase dimerization/phosphoacceptor domain -containing protein [uncultured Maribacter sp.]